MSGLPAGVPRLAGDRRQTGTRPAANACGDPATRTETATDDGRPMPGSYAWAEDSVLMERLAAGCQDALAVAL